jgi:tetratricopeptide (TPR) repeat protein
MPKLARLPANDGAQDAASAEIHRIPRAHARYFAFLSYSHKDEELADWLHRELEEFRVPRSLAGKLTDNGVVPRRLTPIFRDQHELSAANDLGEEIREALEGSQFLIVLCSPDAAKSHWTNAEIESFKRRRPDGCVLAAIASGEPFASEIPGREGDECFPPALRQKYDRRGRPTGKRAEPLAADLREEGESRRIGFLKLVAGMLGVGLDDLVQRETTRRHRRLAWLAAASLAGMAITSTLAITAVRARDAARDQRREAEGLVSFMLGDLKEKLEPIGRLDALDGVGSRVLNYYSKQDTSQLSDAGLLQRSRALSLMGEVANARGNLDEAARLYREAMSGTAEAVQRNPNDPQRLFDHAQNVFWVGDIARQRGDLKTADARLRQYKDLADRMVALQPNDLKYRMESQYAEFDLGVVLLYERRFDEARRQFAASLRTIQAVARVDSSNGDYRKSVADSLGWLADAEFSQSRISDAIEHRRQQVALLEDLYRNSADARDRERLVPALQRLSRLLEVSGDLPGATQQIRSAVDIANAMLAAEPTNTGWMNDAAAAKLGYAGVALSSGDRALAVAQANESCALVNKLIATDRTTVDFQTLLRLCLQMQTKIAIAGHDRDRALQLGNRALAVARSIRSSDVINDRFEVASSQRLVGDAQQIAGDSNAARESWIAAEKLLPTNTMERPRDMALRMSLYQRLGRPADVREIAANFNAMGYRRPEL